MVKRQWSFYVKPAGEAEVNCAVKVTGPLGGERTITVELENLTSEAKEEPLTVEVLREGVVVETVENQLSVAIDASGKTTKEYLYTPQDNGWFVRVTYGED